MASQGGEVARLLLAANPRPRIALEFKTPLDLLVATILSAQCTDARVNEVTRSLFKKYRSAADYAGARREVLESEIRSTGFYRNKAKTLIDCCRHLDESFQGKVPETLEELTQLPGVGRKTANVVLGSALGQQAIAVDTHVLRVSNRLGLVETRDPDKAEQLLMEQVPRVKWTRFTLAMIAHGRQVCTARKPRCAECVLFPICAWPDKGSK